MSSVICIYEDGREFRFLAETCNSATSVIARLLQAREQRDVGEYPLMTAISSLALNGYPCQRSDEEHEFLCSILMPNEWNRLLKQAETNPALKIFATVDVNEDHINMVFGRAAYPDRKGILEVPYDGALDLLRKMNGLGLGKSDEFFTTRTERFERELACLYPSTGLQWLPERLWNYVESFNRHKPNTDTYPLNNSYSMYISSSSMCLLRDMLKVMKAHPAEVGRMIGWGPIRLGSHPDVLSYELERALPRIPMTVQPAFLHIQTDIADIEMEMER